MPCEILHPMVWSTSVHSLALILKTNNVFLPFKLIFWKSYQSWLPSKFSKAHISVVGNPSTTILYHIIIRPTLNIFWKRYKYYKKDTKVGSQNFCYHIWFCTRLLMWHHCNIFVVRYISCFHVLVPSHHFCCHGHPIHLLDVTLKMAWDYVLTHWRWHQIIYWHM